MKPTLEQIRSVFFGSAVGDALGFPVQFKKRNYLKSNPISEMTETKKLNYPKGIVFHH